MELTIQMLGTFSITSGDRRIDDDENRSRKVWLLLAYMISRRREAVTEEELIRLLWGEGEESSSNPTNALKTMFHRVRTLLNQLSPEAGRDLILRRAGSYAWNPAVPVRVDVEEFQVLCDAAEAEPDGEQKLALIGQAVELYKGDFLTKLSSETWVAPITAYGHNRYLCLVLEALPLLEGLGRWEEAAALARRALTVEPLHQKLHVHLLRALLRLDRQKEAISVYEAMNGELFSRYGVMPDEDLRALYREALRTVNDRAIPMGLLLEQLREPDPAQGAMICDYDFFKVLYRAEARALGRSGEAVHIALLSVDGVEGKELAKRSLDRAMENLQDQVRLNLRRGDVASRCSVSQFILLLHQANYENSMMVCRRIVQAFRRQYPHSPAEVSCSVQPLEAI